MSPPGLQVLIFSQEGDPAKAELWSASSLMEPLYGIPSASTGLAFTLSCPLLNVVKKKESCNRDSEIFLINKGCWFFKRYVKSES